MRFSIVIPTYEYNNLAPELLKTLLDSIESQDFKDYEIVISDHSKTDIVKDFISNYNLPINYFKNERGRGNSSVNMNEGIKKSVGEYIKIMHMDDWFCNDKTLSLINAQIELEPTKNWGGVGFNHFYEESNQTDRYILPHINDEIRTLLGCPSVSFFKNDENFYDEDLIIINDSDLHIRLGKKYGEPMYINEYCVTVRMSQNQVSNNVSADRHLNEINYYRTKNF